MELDGAQDGAVVVEDGIDEGGVEGVADGEFLGAEPLCGGPHGLRVAGEHHGVPGVDGGETDPVTEQGRDLGLGRGDGDHRAGPGQRVHQRRAGDDERAGVPQRQDPSEVGGGDLADGVSDQHVRPHSPGLQGAGDGDGHGEQTGLGEPRPVDRLAGGQRLPHVLGEASQHPVPLGGEGGEGGGETETHPGALCALTAAQERGAPGHRTNLLPVPGVQRVGADDHRAVAEGRARGGQGERDVGIVGIVGVVGAAGAQVGGEPGHLIPQGGGAVRGEDPWDRTDRSGSGAWLGRGGFLDDEVGVGAADTERRHPGAADPLARLPRLGLVQQRDLAGGPVDVRGGPVGVAGARQHAVLQGEHDLEHAADAGGGLAVPDVGLERAQPQRAASATSPAVGIQQGLGLDRVTETGSGAVRLHSVHIGWFESRVGERPVDDAALGGPVGSGEAVGGAVGVDRRSGQQGEDGVPGRDGVGEPFQDEHTGALRPAGAVGLGGEGFAAAVGGQTALLGELQERAGRGHDGHAARERERALPGAQ